LDRRLGGLQSRSEGDEENSQPLQGLELLIIQPVAQCYTSDLLRNIVYFRIMYAEGTFSSMMKIVKGREKI